MKIKNICCIGAGYVGGPTMAVISYKCPDIQVEVVDSNKERVDQWNVRFLTTFNLRTGLAKIVKECRGRIYIFYFFRGIKKADIFFMSVNIQNERNWSRHGW